MSRHRKGSTEFEDMISGKSRKFKYYARRLDWSIDDDGKWYGKNPINGKEIVVTRLGNFLRTITKFKEQTPNRDLGFELFDPDNQEHQNILRGVIPEERKDVPAVVDAEYVPHLIPEPKYQQPSNDLSPQQVEMANEDASNRNMESRMMKIKIKKGHSVEERKKKVVGLHGITKSELTFDEEEDPIVRIHNTYEKQRRALTEFEQQDTPGQVLMGSGSSLEAFVGEGRKLGSYQPETVVSVQEEETDINQLSPDIESKYQLDDDDLLDYIDNNDLVNDVNASTKSYDEPYGEPQFLPELDGDDALDQHNDYTNAIDENDEDIFEEVNPSRHVLDDAESRRVLLEDFLNRPPTTFTSEDIPSSEEREPRNNLINRGVAILEDSVGSELGFDVGELKIPEVITQPIQDIGSGLGFDLDDLEIPSMFEQRGLDIGYLNNWRTVSSHATNEDRAPPLSLSSGTERKSREYQDDLRSQLSRYGRRRYQDYLERQAYERALGRRTGDLVRRVGEVFTNPYSGAGHAGRRPRSNPSGVGERAGGNQQGGNLMPPQLRELKRKFDINNDGTLSPHELASIANNSKLMGLISSVDEGLANMIMTNATYDRQFDEWIQKSDKRGILKIKRPDIPEESLDYFNDNIKLIQRAVGEYKQDRDIFDVEFN